MRGLGVSNTPVSSGQTQFHTSGGHLDGTTTAPCTRPVPCTRPDETTNCVSWLDQSVSRWVGSLASAPAWGSSNRLGEPAGRLSSRGLALVADRLAPGAAGSGQPGPADVLALRGQRRAGRAGEPGPGNVDGRARLSKWGDSDDRSADFAPAHRAGWGRRSRSAGQAGSCRAAGRPRGDWSACAGGGGKGERPTERVRGVPGCEPGEPLRDSPVSARSWIASELQRPRTVCLAWAA